MSNGGGIFEDWYQRVLTFAVAAVLIVAVLCLGVLLDVRSQQQSNRRTGFQNRAAVCAVAKNLRMTLPTVCLDRNVTRYYDASGAGGGTQPSAALCAIARRLDVDAPSCP